MPYRTVVDSRVSFTEGSDAHIGKLEHLLDDGQIATVAVDLNCQPQDTELGAWPDGYIYLGIAAPESAQ